MTLERKCFVCMYNLQFMKSERKTVFTVPFFPCMHQCLHSSIHLFVNSELMYQSSHLQQSAFYKSTKKVPSTGTNKLQLEKL